MNLDLNQPEPEPCRTPCRGKDSARCVPRLRLEAAAPDCDQSQALMVVPHGTGL